MTKILALIGAILVSCTVMAQTPCSECSPLDSIWCQLYPDACHECFDTCIPDAPRRVRPIAPWQPGVSYALHRTIGLWAIDYEQSNLEMTDEIANLGFYSVNLWTDDVPYCPGEHIEPWIWETNEPGCEAEEFWKHTRAKQIFVRYHAWEVTDDGGCRIMERAPLGFIVHRLYELIWYRNITVVFAPWEQDWYALGCFPCNDMLDCCPDGGECTLEEKRRQYMDRQDWLVNWEEKRQRDVETARRTMLQRYPNASLNVLHAMTINRYKPSPKPGEEWASDLPTLAERIGEMDNKPDLVLASYHIFGEDPVPVLDWVQSVTGYPRHRIAIAEFGGRHADEQVQRYSDYIPVFWDWGIRTIMIWIYKEGEYGSRWEVTPEGLSVLQDLNLQAITWGEE